MAYALVPHRSPLMSSAPAPTIQLNDFRAQWRDIRVDALAAFERVGESGWLVLGNEVRDFEAQLASSWGLAGAVGCGNGLDALELALRALGLKPGEKVLTTPLSAFATTLAVVRAGGTPVFVDVDETGLLDLDRADAAFTQHSDLRFFVPVHLYGHALDARRLASLKQRHGLTIVEDCAQAVGATSDGAPVGSVGEMVATSFYPTKNLGCMGDGGAVLTGNEALAARVRSLRDYGQSAKYVHMHLGMNSRLDELHAAILRSALLPRLEKFTQRRREIAKRFNEEIRHPSLRTPTQPRGSASVWHLYPLLVEGDRASFRSHLDAAGIGNGLHYPKLIPDQEALRETAFSALDPLTNAHRFADRELSLPIHPYLSDANVNSVIAACNSWRS